MVMGSFLTMAAKWGSGTIDLDHPADLVPVVGSVMLHQGHGVGLQCSVSWLLAGCCRCLSKSWMTLSVVVQSWLFQLLGEKR